MGGGGGVSLALEGSWLDHTGKVVLPDTDLSSLLQEGEVSLVVEGSRLDHTGKGSPTRH